MLLRKGRLLSDRDLALAAAMNHPTLPVHRKPKVALLATGDELVMPGSKPAEGQIVYSSGYALRALALREGAEVIDLGIARDTLDATTKPIRAAMAAGADILATTGGASVGEHDLVKRALEAEGIEIAFWRIAMRPGKPMMHGRRGALRVLGLPGNPVSSYVCATLFLVPLIFALCPVESTSSRARSRPCSAGISPPTISAKTICARRWRSAPTRRRSSHRSACKTAHCRQISHFRRL